MAETTQILFDSPALHSLKRDQLMKLCKLHSLKASGKNVQLIERLEQHALTLSPTAPRNDKVFSLSFDPQDSDRDTSAEPPSPSCTGSNAFRPSEQWEVVMEDIQEVDEGGKSSQGIINSTKSVGGGAAGEFGTDGGKGL